ncbi:hypothetical protein TNCV_3706531 [Trichonephila clavipes]|nr:hypothetical protein TNCV_3706531 [Trichonephila clavipes]
MLYFLNTNCCILGLVQFPHRLLQNLTKIPADYLQKNSSSKELSVGASLLSDGIGSRRTPKSLEDSATFFETFYERGKTSPLKTFYHG